MQCILPLLHPDLLQFIEILESFFLNRAFPLATN